VSQYVAKWRDGYQVVWRNLTWAEYKRFKDLYAESPFAEPMDVALNIYQLVYIKGPDPKIVPAGIAAFITKQQMHNNPYSGRYEDIAPAVAMARQIVMSDYLLSAKALIASTLNYRPEEIENWDPNTFFLRLAQAEVASGRTFDPVDPKAPKDTKGQPIPQKKPHRPLTQAQQQAIERTREARIKG
jgi:hypothetical protein